MRCQFAVLLLALLAMQAGALTVEEAERLTLSRDNFRSLQVGRIDQARSEIRRATTWPNPAFSVTREKTDRPDGTERERSYWLSQQFDLSGERGLRRDAAGATLQARESEARGTRQSLKRLLRLTFYQALYWQRRGEELQRWQARLQEALSLLRRQQQAGETARYDVLRMQRSLAEYESRRSAAAANQQRSLARLEALIDRDVEAGSLQGWLLLATAPPLDKLMANTRTLPRLAALEAQSQASELTARAAGRAAIPDITLGVGRKEISQGGQSFDGELLRLGVSIPLFDRNQAERDRARAEAMIARSEYAVTQAEIKGELQGRWRQLVALRQAATAFAESHEDSSAALIRAAEAGYHGDEIGVLELVDAYQNSLDAELRLLELEKQARDAHTELMSLTEENENEQ